MYSKLQMYVCAPIRFMDKPSIDLNWGLIKASSVKVTKMSIILVIVYRDLITFQQFQKKELQLYSSYKTKNEVKKGPNTWINTYMNERKEPYIHGQNKVIYFYFLFSTYEIS